MRQDKGDAGVMHRYHTRLVHVGTGWSLVVGRQGGSPEAFDEDVRGVKLDLVEKEGQGMGEEGGGCVCMVL